MTFAILADGRPSIALVAPAFLACALFAYEVVRQIAYCILPRSRFTDLLKYSNLCFSYNRSRPLKIWLPLSLLPQSLLLKPPHLPSLRRTRLLHQRMPLLMFKTQMRQRFRQKAFPSSPSFDSSSNWPGTTTTTAYVRFVSSLFQPHACRLTNVRAYKGTSYLSYSPSSCAS